MAAISIPSRASHFEKSLRTLIMFFCLFLSATQAFAFGEAKPETIDVKDPLVLESRLQPSSVEAGGTIDLAVQMHLAKNYHAYLERFKLVIESPDDLKLAPFKIDHVVKFMDAISKTEKQGVVGDATLHALIEVPVGFTPGAQTVKLKLTYQACTEDHCLFPKTLPLSVGLTVKGPAAGHAAAAAPTEFENALQKGTASVFFCSSGLAS